MPIAIIWFNFLVNSIFLSGVAGELPGTADPLIKVYDDNVPIDLNIHLRAYKTEEDLGPRSILELIEGGQLERAENNVSPGFSTSYYWLSFSLENFTDERLYLELDNPHVDYVNLYQIIIDIPVLINSTGDKKEFSTRDVTNRRFVFDLGENQTSHYLMMVDKRYASVSFPLRVWSEPLFVASENQANVLFGIYFGIFFFIGIFSLISGISVNDRLFLSYGVYVLIFSLYIFTQLGFSFEYLYPNSIILNNYSRVVLAILMVISVMDFFRKFLNVDVYLPKISKGYKWISYMLLGFVALWFVDKQINPEYAKTTTMFLSILYFVVFTVMFSTLYIAFKTWHNQKETVMLFLAAFSALLIGSGVYILIEFGLLPETNFPVNPILLGSIVEVLILSASMVYRVKAINDKKNELTLKIAMQQRELMKAFVKGGEKERSRMSAELHDNIGSNLSLLKAKINKSIGVDESLNSEIDRLCEDVRNLSHQLMPHEMEITGLENTLIDYSKKFQKDTGIEVDLGFYSFPKLEKEISFQLYRVIQEALQNILKHANARRVEIQLLGYDREVVVTVDDDGDGFDISKYEEGNGLVNMKTRIEAAEGTMDVASYPGRGTNLLFKIPFGHTE